MKVTDEQIYRAKETVRQIPERVVPKPIKPKNMEQRIVFIQNYSDKAVIVTGDTKPVKDQLKAQGGRFNPRLKDPETGDQVCGWVFSKATFQKRMVADVLEDTRRDGIIQQIENRV